MLDTETQVTNYLKRLNVRFEVIPQGQIIKSDWNNQKVNHYKINIGMGIYDFYQGLGIKTNPTSASVLHSLLMDRRFKDYSIQDYLDEFTGQDYWELTKEESDKIEYMLEAIESNSLKLEHVFNQRQLTTLERILKDY